MKRYTLPAVLCLLLLSGCATYHITTQSLRDQLAGTKMEKKPNLLIPVDNIKGNNLITVNVLDKKEQPYTLKITQRTGVRIKQNNGTKVTFYFNTLQVTDSTITGSKTHLYNAKIKPVLLRNITSIELQK